MKLWMATLTIVLSVCMVWSVQPAMAQARGGEGKLGLLAQRRAQRWNALAKHLNLTDEQKAKIKSIVENARQEAQKVRANSSLTPQEKRTRLRDLRRNTRQEIGSVLTPEQRTKLQKLRAWAWHRWQVQCADRAGKVAKALGLNKAQEKAIGDILRRARRERQRIWNDSTLTPQQKMQKLMELRRKTWQDLRQQWTPEQQSKLRAGIARRWRLWNRLRQSL